MTLFRPDAPLQVLVVTKGHPFLRDPFFAMFEHDPEIAVTHVEHPAAQQLLTAEGTADYDAVLLYDMPGIEFRPGAPRFHDPSPEAKAGFLGLLDAGTGVVFLHHALAGWPTWPEYAEIAGARFLYQAGEVAGEALPDSGYRHGVDHHVSVVDPAHPVTEGLGEGFDLRDELYLFRVLEDRVTPLLRSDARFESDAFYSAALAVAGTMHSREGWTHPAGSDWIAWTHEVRASRIVAITAGDGPDAYGSPALRRLLGNAIRFVAARRA